MNGVTKMSKSANDNAELVKKYLGRALLAGGAAAAIAELAKKKPKSVRDETTSDIAGNGDAIVVQIKKDKFMEGIPTPSELAASRGEGVDAPAGPAPGIAMSKEDMEAKKREILRNGRKINFFGLRKAAEDKSDVKKTPENAVDNGDDGENKDAKKKKVDLPRDEEGKFVSPTNPVGVLMPEKTADVLDYIWNLSKEPVAISAGLVGSVYIASKIASMINKRRREASEYDLEKAREEYVGEIQGKNEKTANDGLGPIDRGVQMGIGAFVVPLALTAMITNKIIENRKIDKKKEKEMSDSYPDEPVMLYKTSEDKIVEVSPRRVVAMIAVKRAMFEAECFGDNVKSAMTQTEAVNDIVGRMLDPANDEHVLNAAKSYYDNRDADAARGHLKKMFGIGDVFHRRAYENPDVWREVMSDPRVQRSIGDRFTDKRYAESWGKFGDQVFETEVARRLGLRPGSWLHMLISWLGNATGLGRGMAGRGMVDQMSNILTTPKAVAAAPAQTQVPAPAQVQVPAQAQAKIPAQPQTQAQAQTQAQTPAQTQQNRT